MSDTNILEEKFKEIRDVALKAHPFPVIACSMNKEQVLNSLKSTDSIYNTSAMEDWLSNKIFEFDVTLDDEYIERIEAKFKRTLVRYIKNELEDVLDEH